MKQIIKLILITLLLLGCSKSSDSSPAVSIAACGNDEGAATYLKVCTFVSTPTSLESVTIKNYDSQAYTLTSWKLCDKNAYDNGQTGCQSLSSTVIGIKSTATLTSLPFGINDSGETIYLINDAGQTIHTKSN